ncbi:MAG TPA: hypothetical protein VM658_08610 [bacterium]|nr:hypothetical protein [bacterium]
MRIICNHALAAAGVAVFLLLAGVARAENISFTPPATYRIKDGPAQRVIGVQDGVLAYTAITSTTPGKVRQFKGVEFIIYLGKGRPSEPASHSELVPDDFQVTDAAQPGPGTLDLTLSSGTHQLDVLIHYRQDPGSFFIRKWIELRPRNENIFVHRIVLEAFKPWDQPKTFAGPGQPVYVGDTFWGVAYPSAENTVEGGEDGRPPEPAPHAPEQWVSCGYLVGLTIGPVGYVSREAVYGVAAAGKVREAFDEYIGIIRARPPRPFLLWNTWYDIFNYSEPEVEAGIAGLKKNLAGPYGIALDSVVLDDGWDDFQRLWQPDRVRFPAGFGPVSKAAGSIGARLGLWMSPIGGYALNHSRRILGTLGQGYEKNLAGFCFAGKYYQRAFAERMTDYVRENGVNYFKLDNLKTSCNSRRHGHRVGPCSQAGLTDAFIEVLQQVRAADPGVMINFTVGSWLSPWWLMYSDVLWRGGGDFGFAGQGSLRQRNITYVDQVLFQRLRVERSQFPISSIMTHGIIKGRRQSFGETGENLRDLADDAWMYFGRGVMMQELYLSPDLLTGREWRVLADAIAFARENAAVLARSEMIGGDPAAGEPYAFDHRLNGQRILAIRNPAPGPRELPPDISSGLASDCAVIYSSSNHAPRSALGPLETRIISCGAHP